MMIRRDGLMASPYGAAHDLSSVAARDLVRDAWLREKGIRVLRFPAVDILQPACRESVYDTIVAALRSEI